MPSSLKMTSLRLDEDLLAGLQQVKERDGVPVTEQVRRAIRAWLDSQGVAHEATRKRRGKEVRG